MQKKRLVALLITLLFLATVLFSYNYISENVHHNCTHDDNCPICMEIEACLQFVSSIRILPVIPLFIGFLYVISQAVSTIYTSVQDTNTLISLKVELLD